MHEQYFQYAWGVLGLRSEKKIVKNFHLGPKTVTSLMEDHEKYNAGGPDKCCQTIWWSENVIYDFLPI